MLTIVELGPVAPARIEGLRALLDELDADSAAELGLEQGIKWVLVQPGKSQWTEAHGYELILEHVEVPRWALHTPELALPHPRRLLELVHLYRPSALLCRSPLLAPLAASVAGLRLTPRPARLCTWVDGAGELAARGLGSTGSARLLRRVGARMGGALELGLDRWTGLGLRSFDALLVADELGAESLRAQGLASLYLTPRGIDRSRFHALRADREPERSGPRVFVELGRGVPLASLRALEAALCRGLPRDPQLCVHAPGRARDPALTRFVEARAHVESCPPGDAWARAEQLRRSELALLLPGFDDGHCAELEARACACPQIVAGSAERAKSAGASASTQVVAWGSDTVERMAAAGLSLLRGQAGQAGQAGAQRAGASPQAIPVLGQVESLLLELRAIVDAVEAVHTRGSARPGLHRLAAAPAQVLAGAKDKPC